MTTVPTTDPSTANDTAVVRQHVPLQGIHWPTIDPFLFIAHHLDEYPASDGGFAPAASLAGRELGNDFAGTPDAEGRRWRMYHGHPVPGFPQHPHRGFETVTYIREGIADHSDSLGAAARFGDGDVQWLTAGSGIVHSEMFPLLHDHGPNTLELFQIWLNLPRADKMVDPHFSMLWADRIPVRTADGVEVTVIAGRYGDADPAPPPPASWASHPEAEVAIWHAQLEEGATWPLPPTASGDTLRMLYFFRGTALTVGDDAQFDGPTGALLTTDRPVPVRAIGGPATVLVLQGRPIGEPVAQYGPFVMNDRAGIEQAFRDYQATGFGGWPWPADGPVHGAERVRFARHPDGRDDRPAAR
jgi:redox-sensitive bicupin YhaK (pirin superfamily)